MPKQDESKSGEPRIWARQDRAMSPPQRKFARAMRTSPTEAEEKLWWHFRHRLPLTDTHFRRQVRIGRYIDFVFHAKRIIIEVDGSQHGPRSAIDEERTQALVASGYKVLRYWNNDVLTNIDGVLADILSKINCNRGEHFTLPLVGRVDREAGGVGVIASRTTPTPASASQSFATAQALLRSADPPHKGEGIDQRRRRRATC